MWGRWGSHTGRPYQYHAPSGCAQPEIIPPVPLHIVDNRRTVSGGPGNKFFTTSFFACTTHLSVSRQRGRAEKVSQKYFPCLPSYPPGGISPWGCRTTPGSTTAVWTKLSHHPPKNNVSLHWISLPQRSGPSYLCTARNNYCSIIVSTHKLNMVRESRPPWVTTHYPLKGVLFIRLHGPL